MIIKRLAPLEKYSTEQFKDWLVIGARKMCGVDHNVADAFSPIADLIGASREISWIKELAVVYTMLSSSACSKFAVGLDNALSTVAYNLSDRDWEVAIVLVDLMREVDAHPRMEGLNALTDRLTLPTSGLSIESKKKLALNALMATFETRPSEQSAAQPVAQKLADLAYQLFADRQQEVSDRLKPGFAKLRIPSASQGNNDGWYTKLCGVLSRGSRHDTQEEKHAAA